jgi:hypothetical protein
MAEYIQMVESVSAGKELALALRFWILGVYSVVQCI